VPMASPTKKVSDAEATQDILFLVTQPKPFPYPPQTTSRYN